MSRQSDGEPAHCEYRVSDCWRVCRFELPGLAAPLILILMAATSHDSWPSVLSPPVWKALHMLVYVAYALLIGHVALGTLQAGTGGIGPLVAAAGVLLIIELHQAAGLRERRPAPVHRWPHRNRALGEFSLRGEIVDSKRWTGGMNPAEGKAHLDCAVCCLSGGPMRRDILPAVGRPVQIRGGVFREGALLFLRAAPDAIQILP